jgi:hypothetical protein
MQLACFHRRVHVCVCPLTGIENYDKKKAYTHTHTHTHIHTRH